VTRVKVSANADGAARRRHSRPVTHYVVH